VSPMRRRASFREMFMAEITDTVLPASPTRSNWDSPRDQVWKGQDSDFSAPHSPPAPKDSKEVANEHANEPPYWW
jgi:hypothetical protein